MSEYEIVSPAEPHFTATGGFGPAERRRPVPSSRTPPAEEYYLPAIREELPVELIPAVTGVGVLGHLTPQNQPVPRPDYLPADWQPKWEQLRKPTPKDYRRVARNREGAVLYRYAPIAFFIKRANEVWGEGNWRFELIREFTSEPTTAGNFDYTVIGQFVAPCTFGPTIGVGTSTYYANNPQESMAKTRNAAYTSAFKAALKSGYGIGRDIEEDDPEVVKIIEGRAKAIETTFKNLSERGKLAEAQAVVRKHSPGALLETGELLISAIEFENAEPIQRELQDMVIAASKVVKA